MSSLSLIPQPQSIVSSPESFILTPETNIITDKPNRANAQVSQKSSVNCYGVPILSETRFSVILAFI